MSDVKHGEVGTYIHRKCRCSDCTDAHTAWNREQRATRRAAPKEPGDPRHGTPSFYSNHGCRCQRCTEAAVTKRNHYRQIRKAAS